MKKQKNAPQILPREEWPYEVPENWVWTRLKHIIKLVSGQDVSVKLCNNEGKGLPYIMGASNIVGEQFIAERWIENPVVVSHKNDILLSVKGTVGKIYVQKEEELNISRQIMAISPYSCLDSTYCKYDLENIVEGLQAEAVGLIPGISRKNVLEKEIPLPPLPEQQRIVARIESLFAKLDAAAEKIRAALDQFPTRKAAILHKAFTGELTKKWREENGVGMESWEYKILSETDLKIIDGDRGTNYPKREELTNTGYCVFLNAKNVTKDGFSFDEVQFISYEKDSLLRTGKLERGDIVLTTRGTIGNTAYYDESIPYQNVRINSGMVIYRGGTQFFKPFLMWFYKSEDLSQQIEKLKTGTAQPQLPIKVMNNLLLPIPLIKEQKEIVRILDVIFEREQAAKETAERLLEQIALTKKSILARAFHGLLGTNDPKEESAEGWLKESNLQSET